MNRNEELGFLAERGGLVEVLCQHPEMALPLTEEQLDFDGEPTEPQRTWLYDSRRDPEDGLYIQE